MEANCGHCPACGRANVRPAPAPYWPYWGYGPYWGYPYTYGAPTVIPTTRGINTPNVYGTTTGTLTFAPAAAAAGNFSLSSVTVTQA